MISTLRDRIACLFRGHLHGSRLSTRVESGDYFTGTLCGRCLSIYDTETTPTVPPGARLLDSPAEQATPQTPQDAP